MTQPSHSFGIRFLLIAVVGASLLLAGCAAETGDMVSQPRYDPYEASEFFPDGSSARPLQPGTVAYVGEGTANDPAQTGLGEDGQPVEGFPVEVNAEMLVTGQERYGVFCTPCHGPAGEGNGKVTGFGFPKPPSLLADASRGLTSGQMFDIITHGRGNMFPYGYRVKPDERWAVIAYVRALQLKNGAVTAQDLTEAEIQQIGSQP